MLNEMNKIRTSMCSHFKVFLSSAHLIIQDFIGERREEGRKEGGREREKEYFKELNDEQAGETRN